MNTPVTHLSIMECKHPGKDPAFAIVAIALILLFLALWFADPKHREAGPSRAGWPAAGDIDLH